MTSSKSSQSQKTTKCKFYVREMSKAGKRLETESKLAVAEGWGVEQNGLLVGMEFLFGVVENVLGLGVLVVAESVNILQTIDS